MNFCRIVFCNIFFFVGVTFSCIAQNVVFDWAHGSTSVAPSFRYAESVAVDEQGNTLVVGSFEDNIDFDPGPGSTAVISEGGYDVFILKVGSTGNLVWAKSVGSLGDDRGISVDTDSSGNIYVTGSFTETVDFDPGPGSEYHTSLGSSDIFVLKLDQQGDLVWVESIGSTGTDLSESLHIDEIGNILLTGFFELTMDVDPGIGVTNLVSFGARDIFVLKLDQFGSFWWAKSMGGPSNDNGKSISTDAQGNVLLTGTFRDSADLDPGPGTTFYTSAGFTDIFIQKFSFLGNLVWTSVIEGPNSEEATSITVDNFGNVYVTGNFAGVMDFDPGVGVFNLIGAGAGDIFIQKLDLGGNLLWAKSTGGLDNDISNSIAVDAVGSSYITGFFTDIVDFDPGPGVHLIGTNNSSSVFVQKLDSMGEFKWAKNVEGGATTGHGIALSPSGSKVLVAGHFQGIGDFDPGVGVVNLPSSGQWDAFVLSWGECFDNSSSFSVTACLNYTVPSGDEVYTQSGTYMDTITNVGGCDSVMTIHVTIVNSNSSAIINEIACQSYASPSGNYNWTSSGAYTDTIPNAIGCDSVITINLTVNSVDNSVMQSGATLMSNAVGVAYQWIECDSGYVAITGATGQSFTPKSNGTFAVEVMANGCTDTSSCFLVTNVGLEEQRFGSQLMVYPNPTTGNFIIDLGQEYENVNIIVRNVLGKVVSTKHFGWVEKTTLELEGTPGIYFIDVQKKTQEVKTVKVLKR